MDLLSIKEDDVSLINSNNCVDADNGIVHIDKKDFINVSGDILAIDNNEIDDKQITKYVNTREKYTVDYLETCIKEQSLKDLCLQDNLMEWRARGDEAISKILFTEDGKTDIIYNESRGIISDNEHSSVQNIENDTFELCSANRKTKNISKKQSRITDHVNVNEKKGPINRRNNETGCDDQHRSDKHDESEKFDSRKLNKTKRNDEKRNDERKRHDGKRNNERKESNERRFNSNTKSDNRITNKGERIIQLNESQHQVIKLARMFRGWVESVGEDDGITVAKHLPSTMINIRRNSE
jgi:hypothetical protein